jgi:hypothetical protein
MTDTMRTEIVNTVRKRVQSHLGLCHLDKVDQDSLWRAVGEVLPQLSEEEKRMLVYAELAVWTTRRLDS